MDALLQLHRHCATHSLADIRPQVALLRGPIWCFIQGTPDLLAWLPHTWPEQVHVVCSLSVRADITEPQDWASFQLLSHLRYGGVIAGEWLIVSNVPALFPLPPPTNVIPRRVCHVVDKTRPTSRFTVAPLRIGPMPTASHKVVSIQVEGMDCVDWEGVLPATKLSDVLVYCQSVHSATKWVVRPLTTLELMAAYDVSETLLPSPEWKQAPTHTLPFLDAAPSRLLCAVLERIVVSPAQERPTPSKRPLELVWPETQGLNWQGLLASTTKSDDAEAPKQIWDDRVLQVGHDLTLYRRFERRYGINPLDSLRLYCLRVWRLRVWRSLHRYLLQKHGTLWALSEHASVDREVGRDCLCRASQASWWEWCLGSTPFFWRWPESARSLIRDGHPPWFTTDPPRFLQPQRVEKDLKVSTAITLKLSNVAEKGYIQPGQVLSLTRFFAVPKGDADIRMVYDASVSGLNDSLWVPSFVLPGVDSLTDSMGPGSWMGDLDMGEEFLNFPLHPQLQQYCGIDVRPYLGQNRQKTMWWRWARCMMGLKPSPYFCVKGTYLAEEVAMGNPADVNNPFHWETVRLNLPGSPLYQPDLPWVSRLTSTGCLAGHSSRYIDDLRTIGRSSEHCWALSYSLATTFAFLGLQIALQKFRPPTPHPGPWAGSIAFSSPVGVGVTCPRDKWEKAQRLLSELSSSLSDGGLIPRQSLEITRGFLNHLARTYPVITPFLKGFHLTLDGWRGNRAEDLWKLPREEWVEPATTDAPDWVQPAPRFPDDVACLRQLFSSPTAPTRPARRSKCKVAVYGFVDASTAGHGSSFALGDGSLLFRHGLWGRDTDSLSSNFRELCNLVESIEEAVLLGELDGCELFVFTDNTTAEGGYYRGNSDNRVLFSLILRLRLLEMQYSLALHVIHVAGTRMIQQGTDGLSRGLLTDRVFANQPMSFHIPLHLSALDRSPSLLPWIRSWCPDSHISALTPEGWYLEGHGIQNYAPIYGIIQPVPSPVSWYLWMPPPAACRHALGELATSRHKRTSLNHIIVCPRLFTSRWRKLLYKLADIVVEIPPGTRPFWPASMHEPLVLGLTLRFLSVSPWLLRGDHRILDLERSLREVWSSVSGDERSLLRELCACPATLETVS